MRILIPLLLVLAAAAAFLMFRRDAAVTPSGTGPGASIAAPEGSQPALDLARGEASGSSRAAAAAPEAGAEAGKLAAQPNAADSGLPPAVPEPSLEGGSTTAPVGAAASTEAEKALALKYANWSRSERERALENLRTTLDLQQSSPEKAILEILPALKEEMSWLEANLDG